MAAGFYLMHRGWLENEAFDDAPYCPRSAWAWLIDKAAHESMRVCLNGTWVTLRRGQLTASVRHLAETWKWSRSTTQRFLDRLVQENMILRAWDSDGTASEPQIGTGRGTISGTPSGTRLGTPQNIITICNYDKFQRSRKKSGTASGTPRGTGGGTDAGTERGTAKTENLGQYTKNINKPSDADASADLGKVIYGACVAYLCANGTSDSSARSFFGGLRKSYEDSEIIEVTMAAQREGVVNPRAWITAGLQHRNPKKTMARSAL